jgi:alcohol dehydrogenase
VVVDPLLAVSCPPGVTAHSGMDALSHAVESFLAIRWDERPRREYDDPGFVGKNPISDILALRAVELIGAHLRRAVDDGADVDAREAMALGAMLAGMAFSNAGTGIVHALQYPLGVLTKTSHGLGNTTLMPAAVRSNLDVRTREAAELARALGSTEPDQRAAADQLPDLIGMLAESVGLTPNLRSIGVGEQDLAPMAASASRITRLTENNPQPIDEAGLLAVLQDALDYEPGTRRA